MTSQDTPILEVAQLMRQHHIANIIIIDQQGGMNIPIGIITDRDLVAETLAEAVLPNTVAVGDVMNPIAIISEKKELWDTLRQGSPQDASSQ